MVRLDPQWAGRRRVIFGTLIACLVLTAWAIAKDPGTGALASAVLNPLALLASAVIGSYCFSATFERINGVPSGNVTVTQDSPTTVTTTVETGGGPTP